MEAKEMLNEAYKLLLGRFDIVPVDFDDAEGKKINDELGERGLMFHLMQREIDKKGITMLGMYEGQKLIDFELVHFLKLDYKNNWTKKLLDMIAEDLKGENKEEK